MKIKRRAQFMIIVVALVLFGLIGRLAQLQLFETESFSKHNVNLIEASVKQRTQSITLDLGRGRFIDRNDEAITHDYYPSLVLFPFLKDMEWPVEELAQITGLPKFKLLEAVQNANEPFAYGGEQPLKLTEQQQEKINALKVPGVFALYQQVKTDRIIGEHLIGMVRENKELIERRYEEKLKQGLISANTKIGITGLQKAFDEFLLPEGESKLLYHVDQLGGPLFGLEVKYTAPANPYYPTAIKSTLDKQKQLHAEDLIDQTGFTKGGLVLLDVETSDVLAMVSRPKMNQKNPFADSGGINYLIEPQIPGSVFKVVTAAAAIEKNAKIRGRLFNCDLNLYGESESQRKLGPLNFKDSFSQSCNYTFATLAEEMMAENENILDEYANKLGLTDIVGWTGDVFHFSNFKQLTEEKAGRIWGNDADKKVEKAINQTAIGQKETRISPLAIANMMATIARGGERKQVRSVTEILYKNGTSLYTFSNQDLAGEKLSTYGINNLQVLLEGVVESGTGRRFQNLPYKVAGKSGTAETGRNGLVNKWFAGYFPVDNPKYALVVVELDVPDHQSVTYSVFEKYVQQLYDLDNEMGEMER